MNPVAKSVYEFWFGSEPITRASISHKAKLWWSGGPDFDYDIERRFGKLVEAAAKGAFKDWLNEPKSALALILLNDQFPRNLHRGSGKAFAQDHLAREYAKSLVATEQFGQMHPVEQTFALLPFEHSENLADQEFCVASFKTMLAKVDADWREATEGYLKFAELHAEIVAQFGRFPHRNKALGREATAEEKEWLAEGGARFGQ